jgi:hypothetical protein
MGRKARKGIAKKRHVEPALEEAVAPESASSVQGRVIERPDGFYWEAKKAESHGPFLTLAEAEADMLAGGPSGEAEEASDSLHEAESELGISEWIDPDTGGPAEDNVPRIEDH